jgi:hypothetical protein
MDSDSNVKKLGSTLLFSQRPIHHMLLEIPIDIHTNSSFLFSPLSSLFSFFPLFAHRPIRHVLLEIPIDIHTNSSFLFSPLSSLFSFFPLFFLSVFVWAPLLLRHLGFSCKRRACKQDLQFRSTCALTDALTNAVLFSGGE